MQLLKVQIAFDWIRSIGIWIELDCVSKNGLTSNSVLESLHIFRQYEENDRQTDRQIRQTRGVASRLSEGGTPPYRVNQAAQ